MAVAASRPASLKANPMAAIAMKTDIKSIIMAHAFRRETELLSFHLKFERTPARIMVKVGPPKLNHNRRGYGIFAAIFEIRAHSCRQ
jgi:hypothetical protein